MGDMADWVNSSEPWDGLGQEPSIVYCKYCKKGPFRWEETKFGWRLVDDNNKWHSCNAYRQAMKAKPPNADTDPAYHDEYMMGEHGFILDKD